jgi:3-dehydroquinate synthase
MTTSSPNLPPHRTVRVDLGPRSYDVVIGRGLLKKFYELLHAAGVDGKMAVIVDANVPDLFWNSAFESFPMPRHEWVAKVASGEGSKSFRKVAILDNLLFNVKQISDALTRGLIDQSKIEQELKKYVQWLNEQIAHAEAGSFNDYEKLLSLLAAQRFSRSSYVVALGGGVIGDLAGFVAATYLRGINFVQVPTTLLAMVDSSVGGKTGVNLPEGKNLVGAFHQPKLVVADLDTLSTLPAREFAAGMAEVIKYGAIRDKGLFDRVAKGVKPGDADLDEIVEKCVAIKARIVENDEFETKGERALLNFGHTIGHAIEKATEYKSYLHGEAISLGMRAAAWLSVWHAGLPEFDAKRIEAALTTNGLPLTLRPDVDRAAILAALGNDKKVAADGRNRWVLIKSLGEATSGHELPDELVQKALEVLG